MRKLRVLEISLWAVAAVLLGTVIWVTADRTVFQAYANWSFERLLRRQHRAPAAPEARPGAPSDDLRSFKPENVPWAELPPPDWRRRRPALPPESVIGRLRIPRFGLQAIVLEGTSDDALRRAVGHIEGTSLPGEGGNTGIAGHRDTFFRDLRNIRKDDIITLETVEGRFQYAVESTRIVGPKDVKVLASKGRPVLTLVTCFPFYYVGSAPKRFIVQARQVGSSVAARRQ